METVLLCLILTAGPVNLHLIRNYFCVRSLCLELNACLTAIRQALILLFATIYIDEERKISNVISLTSRQRHPLPLLLNLRLVP